MGLKKIYLNEFHLFLFHLLFSFFTMTIRNLKIIYVAGIIIFLLDSVVHLKETYSCSTSGAMAYFSQFTHKNDEIDEIDVWPYLSPLAH